MNTTDARTAILQVLARTAQIDRASAERYQGGEEDLTFAEMDMDSLVALDFCMALEETFGRPVDPADLAKHPSLDRLALFLSAPA
jgi:acyl carrier protein